MSVTAHRGEFSCCDCTEVWKFDCQKQTARGHKGGEGCILGACCCCYTGCFDIKYTVLGCRYTSIMFPFCCFRSEQCFNMVDTYNCVYNPCDSFCHTDGCCSSEPACLLKYGCGQTAFTGKPHIWCDYNQSCCCVYNAVSFLPSMQQLVSVPEMVCTFCCYTFTGVNPGWCARFDRMEPDADHHGDIKYTTSPVQVLER